MQTKIKKENIRTFVPKDELVDVMYYIADDGKEFKNEYDAKKHNEVLAAKAKELAELKPCPFCGCGTIHIHEPRTVEWDHWECQIRCGHCDSSAFGYNENSQEQSKLEAIKAWNRRV